MRIAPRLFPATVALLFAALGCKEERPPPRVPPGRLPPPGGYYPPPPQGPPGAPRPAAPVPGQPPSPVPQPAGPPAPPPLPQNLPPVANDPINLGDINFMRQRSQSVMTELKRTLASNYQAKVNNVPLVVEDAVGEVNAFAACISGKPLMAITDGLMKIQAQMARARATDEVFGTNKFDAYVQFVAQNQRPKQPIVRPAPGFWNPTQDVDGRKVMRQHQLFEEQLAFVLGHELAHHYLDHTGCAGGQPPFLTPADLNRVLSGAVPGFNQPNEISSDTNGVTNTLNAGRARSGYQWTEGGAMLTLNFFLALKSMSPAESVLFAFELSHPHPSFRIPIVRDTAARWRQSGGTAPASPFPFPIPGLFQ
ncbi:MAG: M48 family metalloprotease [Myxococcota bacterium]